MSLNGAGFTAHVAEGARVKTGDLLLTLDLDVIASGAKSLISPVLLTSEGELRLMPLNRLVAAGEPIMAVRQVAVAEPSPDEGEEVFAKPEPKKLLTVVPMPVILGDVRGRPDPHRARAFAARSARPSGLATGRRRQGL